MSEARDGSGLTAEAFQSLVALQQLTLEAGLSENLKQLQFRVLNRTHTYCSYDRAVLWELPQRGAPRLLGVSGAVEAHPQGPLAATWRVLTAALTPRDQAALVTPAHLPGQEAAWTELGRRTGTLSVIWLPIVVQGRSVAALWLERWAGKRFTAGDLARLQPLALAYGVAWRSVARRPRGLLRFVWDRRRVVAGIASLLALAALVLVPVPLRIIAPCEVVPRDPVVVAAPLEGVIDEILVLPGRPVHAGERLAVYDQRVALEELKVAQQQVQIIESDLQRARVQAFDRPTARAEIALLENRLEQERTRLRIAEYRAARLEVKAPVAGVVQLDDPHAWRGRPVQVGERLMTIVDPQQSKVRIWLPEHDNVPLDPQRPLTIILDSDPRTARSARLLFLSNHSQVAPDGRARFRAEAEWLAPDPNPSEREAPASTLKMGLQGTAILYGEKVPLGYWLLRRPLAAVRRFLGV
ncbi:MAG: HlyD family efflux transporter periplasmic adaptor subunit [Planctomycetota bacterium]